MTELQKAEARERYKFNLEEETVYGWPMVDRYGQISTVMPLRPNMTRKDAVELWKEVLA